MRHLSYSPINSQSQPIVSAVHCGTFFGYQKILRRRSMRLSDTAAGLAVYLQIFELAAEQTFAQQDLVTQDLLGNYTFQCCAAAGHYVIQGGL